MVIGSMIIVFSRVQPDSQPRQVDSPVVINTAPEAQDFAPDFTLTDTSGQAINLRTLRGQVVLVNIWATWCPPCRAEMPMIEAAYQQYRDQGFTVLAVNLREDSRTVADYMTQAGLSFPALLDSTGDVSSMYRASVLPSSFFIDKAGVIRAVYRGPMARSVITGTVEQLLGEQ
jgi:cytochrome c biogenesis protein CcmG, thiol:disulfide interchange protein DsbE